MAPRPVDEVLPLRVGPAVPLDQLDGEEGDAEDEEEHGEAAQGQEDEQLHVVLCHRQLVEKVAR